MTKCSYPIQERRSCSSADDDKPQVNMWRIRWRTLAFTWHRKALFAGREKRRSCLGGKYMLTRGGGGISGRSTRVGRWK